MADTQNGKSREGFGDGQGTRVGKPDEGRSDESGRMGAEGSPGNAGGRGVTRGADAVTKDGQSTGAGAEAAEGVHSMDEREPTRNSGASRGAAAGGEGERGSEPLAGRNREHRSGYGGAGGNPVSSSDQREPNEPTGKAGNAGDSGSAGKPDAGRPAGAKKDPRTGNGSTSEPA